jgi:hypothetical protein
MNKRPALYVIASRPPQSNVVPLRSAPTLLREASWRDLVLRLARLPVKN